MKLINYLVYGLLILVGLTSCKEKFDNNEETGSFVVSIEAKDPEKHGDKVAARASGISASDFPVSIMGQKGTPVEDVTREFPSVSSLPAKPILLPIGQYVVAAHTPGNLEKQMKHPYFAGEKAIDILKNVTTTTKVVCKMKNSKIQLTYQDDFKESFTDWHITIDDGTGSVMVFTEKELNPEPIYYHFGENGAEFLTMNVRAKTTTGNTVVKMVRLSKADADESYEEDTPNFTGGDGLKLDMTLGQNPEGDLQIKVNVNIQFSNHDDDWDINVNDKEQDLPNNDDAFVPGGGDSGNGGNGGGGESSSDIALNLPADFSYSLSGNPAKPGSANAVFSTPKGLKSAVVKIITNNDGFKTTLETAAFDTPGALLAGAELIGNQGIQKLFTDMGLTDGSGQPKTTPKKGDTEYTFPLSTFFTFLDMFTGTHQFQLTLQDNAGGSITKTLTITITE